ncbi:MAG: transcription antitermination factor NusB [Propionivibrio sp.]
MSGATDAVNANAPAAAKKPAKSPRRRAREFALQGLYQWRVGGSDEAAIEAHLADSDGFDRADREFFVGLLRGVLAQHGGLQEQLQAYLDRPFAELSPVEASVLLTGAYELVELPADALPRSHQRSHRAGQEFRRHRRPQVRERRARQAGGEGPPGRGRGQAAAARTQLAAAAAFFREACSVPEEVFLPCLPNST